MWKTSCTDCCQAWRRTSQSAQKFWPDQSIRATTRYAHKIGKQQLTTVFWAALGNLHRLRKPNAQRLALVWLDWLAHAETYGVGTHYFKHDVGAIEGNNKSDFVITSLLEKQRTVHCSQRTNSIYTVRQVRTYACFILWYKQAATYFFLLHEVCNLQIALPYSPSE